jgi:hypothetical protein
MRQYILTLKERKAISKYLEDGKPTDFIHLLRHRAKASLQVLKSDIKLVEKLTK